MQAHINQNIGIKGQYTVKVFNGGGELKQQIGPFDNLITDQGLESYGELPNGSIFSATSCFVGTGTTPPQFTDTAMANFRAAAIGATTFDTKGGSPEYWSQFNATFRFNPGYATGNLTEVGVGSIYTMNPLVYSVFFSRALIVDTEGNPVTITILPDEYLEVTYSLRYYPDLSDTVSTVTDAGTGITHTFTCRRILIDSSGTAGYGMISAVTNNGGYLFGRAQADTPLVLEPITGAVFANAVNLSAGVHSTTLRPYVSGSKTRVTDIRFGIDTGNGPYGIEGIRVGCISGTPVNMYNQMIVNPPIMKTDVKTLAMAFQVSWSRKT